MSAEGAIRRVRDEHLTYLDEDALRDLVARIAELEHAGRVGDILEAGCALGGSAIVLAAAKSAERNLLVYDVFGVIPPPSEQDGEDVLDRYRVIASGCSTGIAGDVYYGYQSDLLSRVREAFGRHGLPIDEHRVELIQGSYEDTLHPPRPVALAHLDCDWYDSVLTCLQRIEPLLVPGGVLVVDDYDTWSGARRAVDEYFAERDGFRFERRRRLHIVREAGSETSAVADRAQQEADYG